jgi:hypothetical protein
VHQQDFWAAVARAAWQKSRSARRRPVIWKA